MTCDIKKIIKCIILKVAQYESFIKTNSIL